MADEETIESLYQQCDIYLDNNKGNELLDAVSRAFENDMVIFATMMKAHNRMFTATENIVMKKVNNLTVILKKWLIAVKHITPGYNYKRIMRMKLNMNNSLIELICH